VNATCSNDGVLNGAAIEHEHALKPTEWPPLAAPDSQECKPAKPRSGRPRKDAAADENRTQ